MIFYCEEDDTSRNYPLNPEASILVLFYQERTKVKLEGFFGVLAS